MYYKMYFYGRMKNVILNSLNNILLSPTYKHKLLMSCRLLIFKLQKPIREMMYHLLILLNPATFILSLIDYQFRNFLRQSVLVMHSQGLFL